ncbi:DUF2634 domain-containing protein [Lachnospiraceae bacterium 46-15]
MIPDNENYEDFDEEDEEDDIAEEFDIEMKSSLTYAMNLDRGVFVGKVDDVEAVRQAAMKILNTERYEHEIYSWDYGVELQDLYGKPIPYVMSEVKQRVVEALTADDRIESVDDFTVRRTGKHTLHLAFTVTTVQEDEFEMESEVEL